MNDPKLPEAVKNFVFEVAQIKGLINEKPPKSFISHFLENVFKYYPGAKDKNIPVVDSKLSKIFIGFKNDLKEFSNNISYENVFNQYAVYTIHQGSGKWVDNPDVKIYDINLRKNDKYNLYPYCINYHFREDIQEVYLSLDVTWGYAHVFLEDTDRRI